MDKRIEPRCIRQIYRNGIEVAFIKASGNGKILVAQPLQYAEYDECECINDVAVTLTYTDAQQLMDELWACGIRPTEGAGSAGSLAATERHLDDMQKIAFGLLKSKGVNNG